MDRHLPYVQWYAVPVKGNQFFIRVLLPGAVMAFLGIVAIAKLLSLGEFENNLVSWGLNAGWLRTAVAIAVPLLEPTLSAAWFFGFHKPRILAIAIAMLSLYTLAYAWIWALGKPPSCGCLGGILRYQMERAEAPATLIRNALLILCLAVSRVAIRSSRPSMRCAGTAAPAMQGPRAFTILEMLLTIALIALLIALAYPSFTQVRQRASRTRSLAMTAEHARALLGYSTDYRDFMPSFTIPRATYTFVYVDDVPVKLLYFDAYWSWHLALADRCFHTTCTSASFYDEHDLPVPPWGATSFWYSASFLADPAFWSMETRTGPDQWRATRQVEVLFPSQKAITFAADPWFSGHDMQNTGRAILGFCDGSGEEVGRDRLIPGYPKGTGAWPGSGSMSYPCPGMVTIDGVRGRDR